MALAVFALILLLAVYVGGYFWLGRRSDVYKLGNRAIFSVDPLPESKPVILRQFNSAWMLTLYKPAARLESAAIRTEVILLRLPSLGEAREQPARST
jgi:hypothetical protein